MQVTAGEYGRTVQVPATIVNFLDPFSELESVDTVLVIEEYSPDVLDATRQAEIARTILSAPLELYIAARSEIDHSPWVFEPEALAQMLAIRRVEQEGRRDHLLCRVTRCAAFWLLRNTR